MNVYVINPVDGQQVFKSDQKGDTYHDVAFSVEGSAPVGSLTIKARKPGGQGFETIPDGAFDIANLNSIQFIGAVKEWEVTISGISGVNTIRMTDTSQGAYHG